MRRLLALWLALLVAPAALAQQAPVLVAADMRPNQSLDGAWH